MDPERFKDSPSGRLARAGRGTATYWAFLPNPLPPSLELSRELVRTLSAADRALGELAGLGRSLANPHLLINPFIRREAVLSSRIEGTQASLADLYAYEAGQLPLPGFAETGTEDVREVANYVHALEYALGRLDTLPVSLRLLREVHQRLLAGVRGEHSTPGEFRTSQNWIGSPGCTLNEATYVPPPVDEMREALGALEKYLHAGDDPFPPLVRLALIHYQFEAIHPFLDGNGRVGRLLISLLLVHWGLLPLPLLYLSAYFEAHRQAYYDLLLAVSERGAWATWVRFFLQGVAEQSQDAAMRAKKLQDLQSSWRQHLQRTRAVGLAQDIAELLFELPVLSVRQIAERFGVSHYGASKALRRLMEMEVVQEITGRERNRLYVASAILRIVG